jgi:6-phosphogluconolactonase (cycloisomerase 2 family)
VGCWTAIDPQAKFVYVSAIAADQISVFSISNPTAPTFVQNVTLGGPKAKLPAGTPEPTQFTTAPFNLSVSPDGKNLYVVTHETCMTQSIDPTCAQGNAIHTLQINPADGTLTEAPYSPLIFPPSVLPNDTHPKGIVVL